MSEQLLIRQYERRKAAEFDAWLAQPSQAPSANNPQPTSGSEPLGPPSPAPMGVWARLYDILAHGVSTTAETAKSGASNIAGGVARSAAAAGSISDYAKQKAKGAGQTVFGAMELLMALPAGVGAAVQQAMKNFVPGMEQSVVPGLGGGKPSDVTTVGFLRTMLMTPQLLLDPRLEQFSGAQLAEALNEPMTYGELANILAMLAAGHYGGRAAAGALRGKGQPAVLAPGAAEAAGARPVGPLALPESTPGAPRPLPPASYAEFGQRVRQPLVTPPPARVLDPVARFQLFARDPEFRSLADQVRSQRLGGPRALPPARDERTFLREQFRTPLDRDRPRSGPGDRTPLEPSGEPATRQPITPEVAAEIARVTEANGGASYNVVTGSFASGDRGYAVTVAPERGVIVDGLPSQEALEQFASKNADLLADPRMHIGTWFNEGKTYLDISAILLDKAEAMRVARQNKQKAIYGFAEKADIPVPDMLRLEHYSPNANLTELDPKKFGSFGAGEELKRASDPRFQPRSYAYVAGTVPEARFQGLKKYSAEVPARSILDLASPEGKALFEEAGKDAIAFEALLRERGYIGYRNSALNTPDSPAKYAQTPGNIVTLFERTPVEPMFRVGEVATDPGSVRVFRQGEGNLATTDINAAPGAGELRYADVPAESLEGAEVGPGQFYLFDTPTRPFYGEIAGKHVDKVEAAKRRLYDAYQRVVRDLTNERGAVDLRGEIIAERMKKNSLVLNDLGTVGAAVLWKGARDLKSFSKEMIAEFGDIIVPHLADVYAKAQETMAGLIDQARFGLPKTRQLLQLFREGEFGKEWYDLAKTEIQDMFGINAETYSKVIAATSPNTQVDANITLANKAMRMILTGEKHRENLFSSADGFVGAHVKNLNRILRDEELSGPKVGPFARAIMGDQNAVVVDTWMLRAFGFASKTADESITLKDSSPALRFIKKSVNDLSIETGATPRQVQAALWVAQKIRDEGRETALEAGRPLHEIVREKLDADPEFAELVKASKDGFEENTRGIQWEPGMDGRAEIGTLLALARAVIGGVAGGLTGDSPEEAFRNALIGMGLGAAVSRALAAKFSARLRSIDPDGAKLTTLTSGFDPSKLGDVFRRVVRRTSERDFNYERMDASRAAKALIQDIDTKLEALKKFRSRSHDETRALAAKSKYNSVEELLKLGDDTPLSGPDYLAARGVMQHIAEETIREAVIGTNPAKVRDLVGLLGEVANRVKEVRTSIARAEESGRIPSRETPTSKLFDVDRVAKAISETKAGLLGLSDAELMGAIKSLADESKVTALARNTRRAPSAFWEIYYGLNLLSSPFTQVRNIIGNTAAVMFGVADRLAGEIVSPVFRLAGSAAKDHVAFGEGFELARGIALNLRNALRAAKNNWQTGDSVFGLGKTGEAVENTGALTAANFGVEGTIYGKAIDAIGAFARGNLRFMGSVDEFYKVLNFAGELAALARRQAAAEGLKGSARYDRMLELQAEPTTEMLLAAKAFAQEQTFTKEFQPGTWAKALETAASFPAARLTVTPFFRTPVRIAEYSSVHTPVLNLLAWQFYSDLRAGGAKAELAWGKLAVGGALMYVVAQAAQDGLITGNGPADPALRKHMMDAGWQPKSVYNPMTGKYYSYDNLEPVSSMVATAADFVHMAAEMPDSGVAEVWTALTVAFAQNAVAKQYWQSLSDLLDVIDGYGRGTDAGVRAGLKYAAGRLNAMTPGASALRLARTVEDPVVREPRTLLEYYANGIPGWSKSVPARRNMITGEPIIYEGVYGDNALALGLSPFRVTTNKNDPVLNEIVIQRGAGLPRELPRVIGGAKPPESGVRFQPESLREGVLLDDQQHARLTELVTSSKDQFGLTLHQALTSLVTETGPYAALRYSQQSDGKDGGKGLAIYGIWRQALKRAEEMLLAEDKTLADQVRRRKLERDLGKLPPSTQNQIAPAMRGVLQ